MRSVAACRRVRTGPTRASRRRGRARAPWPAGSDGSRPATSTTAACMASRVGRSTPLVNSAGSRASAQPRRRFTTIGLALGPVEGGGQRHRHRLPRHQLGVVGGPAAGRVGIVGQAPHDGDGQRLDRAVGPRATVGGQPRGDLAVQPRPGRAARQAQVGGQPLLGFAHLVDRRRLGPSQGMGVVGAAVSLPAIRSPGPRRAIQASNRLVSRVRSVSSVWSRLRSPAAVSLRGVGRHERVQVGAERAHLLEQLVGGARSPRRPRRRRRRRRPARLPAAHVVAVVERDRAGPGRPRPPRGPRPPRASSERREEGRDVPVRERGRGRWSSWVGCTSVENPGDNGLDAVRSDVAVGQQLSAWESAIGPRSPPPSRSWPRVWRRSWTSACRPPTPTRTGS